jgi:hypothetical protein
MAVDCTTVQLGTPTTLVVGEKIDRTTVKINQTSATTITDDCNISLIASADLTPRTTIKSLLTTLKTTEATRVTLIGGLTETITGGGGSGPCDGPTNVTLTYLPDGKLDQAVKDTDTATLGYTGELLTTVTHSSGCTYTLSYDAANQLISVIKS